MQNRALILKLFSAFALCLTWEIAGRVPVSYAFPTFFESMSALAEMTADGRLFDAYAETLRPLIIGISISVADKTATPSEKAKHLGVIFDRTMTTCILLTPQDCRDQTCSNSCRC